MNANLAFKEPLLPHYVAVTQDSTTTTQILTAFNAQILIKSLVVPLPQ